MDELKEKDKAVLMGLNECVDKYGNKFTMYELGDIIRDELDNWDRVKNKLRNYRVKNKFNIENASEDRFKIVRLNRDSSSSTNGVADPKIIVVENEGKLESLVDSIEPTEDSLHNKVEYLENEIERLNGEKENLRDRFNMFAEAIIEETNVDGDRVYNKMEDKL